MRDVAAMLRRRFLLHAIFCAVSGDTLPDAGCRYDAMPDAADATPMPRRRYD